MPEVRTTTPDLRLICAYRSVPRIPHGATCTRQCPLTYGMMSYMVTRRRPEIGVRMALGAGRLDVLRLVLGKAGRLVLAGVIAGVAGALWLSRYAESLLFGVEPGDVASLAVAAGTLTLTALLAAFIPARRAVGVDAAVVLRGD